MASYTSGTGPSHAEEAGSVSESYDDLRGFMKASVTLRCAWGDRHNLVADVVGGRRQWPGGAANVIPVATTASIQPVMSPDDPAVDGSVIKYLEALVTINYTTEVTEVVTESIEPTTEFVTLDHRFFRWGSGSGMWLREEEAPGLLVRGINFVRNELEVTSIHDDTYDKIGSVNNAPIVTTILGRTFATETLLYAPPTINYSKDSAGVTKFQVTKKFTFNQNGWNKYFRPFTNSWEFIYPAGGASPHKSYPPADLSNLF